AENIAKGEALRRILALRSQGQKSIIGFISDQSPQPVNIHDWVDFLHQDTPVFTGTERIAKKVDAAIFFADVQRLRRGRYHCTFRPLSTDVRALPDYQLTELYMRQLEGIIRRQPTLWLWSHKRWKHQRPASD
ncbi:MAG: lysophospholipid acyltransferase family protein, partial [Alloprevotella sp.]|nr:lysophospholipid acyltransferase family protein [Alloprevotella sp.]